MRLKTSTGSLTIMVRPLTPDTGKTCQQFERRMCVLIGITLLFFQPCWSTGTSGASPPHPTLKTWSQMSSSMATLPACGAMSSRTTPGFRCPAPLSWHSSSLGIWLLMRHNCWNCATSWLTLDRFLCEMTWLLDSSNCRGKDIQELAFCFHIRFVGGGSCTPRGRL